jgi:hypothetical protein
MEENPYRSPRETGYRPPTKPASSFNLINLLVAALLVATTLAAMILVYLTVLSSIGLPR